MSTLPADQAAYLAAAIAIVMAIMNPIAFFIGRIPGMAADTELYNWTVRGANFLLSLIAVIAVEKTFNTFTLQNWLPYILAAAGTATGSHVLYTVSSARKRTQLNTARMQIAQLTRMPAVPDGRNVPATPS